MDEMERKLKGFYVEPNKNSHVKKVIGVVSGKGGVGKSSITAMLGYIKQLEGYQVAIMDGDITGPTQGRVFGLSPSDIKSYDGKEIIPAVSQTGIKVMSTNFLLEDEEQPVVWRGPVLADMIKQFWRDVRWGEVDYMFVDMPPGTGDVPLTVFQSLPIDGIIILTSPQQLVSMIVSKAVNMASMMNVPILGVVENMSYVNCPNCDEKIHMFGESHIDELAEKYGLKVLAQLPIDSTLTELSDSGNIEQYDGESYKLLKEAVKDI